MITSDDDTEVQRQPSIQYSSEQSSNAPTLVVSTPDDDTEVQPSTQSSDDMTPDAHAPAGEVPASQLSSDDPTLPVSSSDESAKEEKNNKPKREN